MDKIRIKELADQMSLDVKDILTKCKELSIVARTQSSSISLDDANKIKISIVGKPINSNLQKENDIVKRSGSRVTIRRKKKEPIKEKPKEPAQQQIESKETVKEESKENNKRPEKKVLKTVDLENFSNDNRVDKSDENNNVVDKEISQKEEKKQATTPDFKKKDLPPATKDVTKQKKKPKVKPSKAEIIDEDALDALRSAVKAKLPGARKEFLVSNNYSKKTKTKDNLKEDNRIIPGEVQIEVFNRDKGKCVKCGSTDHLHYDHIIPFSKGGTSKDAKNIRLYCRRHNLEKSDKIGK